MNEEIQELVSTLDRVRAEYSTLQTESVNSMEVSTNQLLMLTEEKSQLQNSLELLQQQFECSVNEWEQQEKELKQKYLDERAKMEAINELNEQTQNNAGKYIESLEEMNNEKENSIKVLQTEIEKMKKDKLLEMKEFNKEKATLSTQLQSVQNELKEISDQCHVRQQQLNAAIKQNESLQRDLAVFEHKKERMMKMVNEVTSQVYSRHTTNDNKKSTCTSLSINVLLHVSCFSYVCLLCIIQF